MTYADKPWLKSYKLGPYKLKESLAPYPVVPIFKALDDAAVNHGGKTALLFEGRTLKYQALKDQADRLAAALAKIGIEKGDRINIFLPNCPEYIVSPWGIQKAGGVIVPTSTLRTDEGIIHEAGNSRSKGIICQEKDLERILGLKDRCGVEHIIVTSDEGYDLKPVSKCLPKGVYEFRRLLEDHDPKPPQLTIDPREDLCELPHTGGSTGLPKAVMVTHYNRYCNLMQLMPWMIAPLAPGIVGKASVLIPLSLFHTYGHYIHQVAVFWGLRIILLPDPRDTNKLVQTIKEFRPFMIPVVPTQLMRLAQAKIGRLNVLALSGSAPLPDEVRQAVQKEMGNPVGEAYGLTETGPSTHADLSGFGRITGFIAKEKKSIGVPIPDTECKLVDPATGEEVPFGAEGEIAVRGPQIMKGYWPEAGSGLTPDGWLHTGDIGYMDGDGYFFLSDRIKDMVNVSGMKVYTTTVDDVLYKHPGVLMAAAFGVPDSKNPGSERVMAVIKLKDEAVGKVSEEEILRFCREKLAPYALPKYIEFRDELPLTATEKLFKRQLREEAIASLKAKGEL
ncbi:MAG: AMP-binding protein [Deltaproteobacteria bacterium]|nr:AMP-binding protein [Deltaproteobacteria bacterium]